MGKIIFYRLKIHLSGANFLVLLLVFSCFITKFNFVNHNINFFGYIDDIITFNCDNFENISLSVYPKELVLKNNTFTNFSSFLHLKINFATDNWLISIYDKTSDFNIKINS